MLGGRSVDQTVARGFAETAADRYVSEVTDAALTNIERSDPRRALIVVSGGDAESPFTTPTAACKVGLAAGNTDTALREHLLAAGYNVYTSPAKEGPGQIESSPGFGGFSDGPPALPQSMTVNAVGDIDVAGEHLAAFLGYLQTSHGVEVVDLVGHSMGGLFSRAAIRVLQESGSDLVIRSLTTLGTPWQGAFAADYAAGALDRSTSGDNETIETIMDKFSELAAQHPGGAGEQVTRGYLDVQGWNSRQAGVLDGIPVTLIGGDHFTLEGGVPEVWPNDGLVALGSALAEGVSADVLPDATRLTFPNVHSIFFADALGLPWEKGLTWNPEALAAVSSAIN